MRIKIIVGNSNTSFGNGAYRILELEMLGVKWKKKGFIGVVTLFAAVLLTPIAVSAHGYVEQQPSRALLCAQGVNQNCGGVQWEPQSTETAKGFPESGLIDGQFASANGIFTELDEQSEWRWEKVTMNHGKQTFQWHLTAAHSTSKWHYYITKKDWDSNAPLTREQFELTPFYEQYDYGVVPGQKVQHEVTVPEREGYHVILAVWDVANTGNAFYHVIDADFSGGGSVPTPDPDPDPVPEPPYEGDTWDSTTTYLQGDRVVYDGHEYVAKWWTSGDQPDISDAWMLLSENVVRTWNKNAVYYGGDRVQYEGIIYEAQWWTKGDVPSNLGVWQRK